MIIPERRAVGVAGTVAKASAGASEHLRIAKVTNIARTLEDLKERNIWTVGLDERGKQTYDSVDYHMDCAIVLGAEGKGLHDLVARKCDFLVSIPMLGKIPSLTCPSPPELYSTKRCASAGAPPHEAILRRSVSVRIGISCCGH